MCRVGPNAIMTTTPTLPCIAMNFLRRWQAQREFRHHFGQGHRLGRHGDGFAHLLMARLGARLALDDEQTRRLGAWLAQLQQQRDAFRQLVQGPELAGFLAHEQFPREAAAQLVDARLAALGAAGPGLVNAFAEFFESLNGAQRQALRSTLGPAGSAHA